jgi:cytochrome d ubiquinol oxidase subunit I
MLLYLVLAVVEVGLIARYAKAGPPEEEPSETEPPSDAGPPGEKPAERPMQFAY